MTKIWILAACLQQPDNPAPTFEVHMELWKPSVRGRMSLDKAFGVDFLAGGAPEEGNLSFVHDMDLERITGAGRIRFEILTAPDLAYVLAFAWSRWQGDHRLEEDKDLGGGVILPAGTLVEGELKYWDLGAGASQRGESHPWFWSGDVMLAFYQLKLDASAGGGEMKALTGALGPVFGGRLGLSIGDRGSIAASGLFHLPLIAGTPRVELGVRLGIAWDWGRLEAGYSYLAGEGGGTERNRFTMMGPALGLRISF